MSLYSGFEEISPHPKDFVDVPVNANFGELDEKFRQVTEGRSHSRKRMKMSFSYSKSDSITLRFTRSSSVLEVTAHGPALDRFLKKNLRIYFDATFDDGFTLSCDSVPEFDAKSTAFQLEKRCRYFQDCMTIDPKTMFKDGQLYTGKFSLEILSQDSFDFKNYQKHVDPMLKSLPVDAKYSFTILLTVTFAFHVTKCFWPVHHSTVLDKMFQTKCLETREKCVKMKASEKGVKAFMKYVYHFDLADAFDSSNVAVDLLDIARVYKVKPLEKAMKTLLLKRAEEWLDLDTALKLFLCTNGKVGLKSLKEKALKFVEPRRDELAQLDRFQEFLLTMLRSF
ncbi:hypothetical protein Ocin01_17796 [Orchesella cincta]|uniref:BTB domain-containing protein n=1 Tax=Orchesella cincta TaxID=48709 RepID=A0A1D2M7C9_ORCCI|nr:hypothetical protein Ocin01_17796 [Orchesella cincta]